MILGKLCQQTQPSDYWIKFEIQGLLNSRTTANDYDHYSQLKQSVLQFGLNDHSDQIVLCELIRNKMTTFLALLKNIQIELQHDPANPQQLEINIVTHIIHLAAKLDTIQHHFYLP